MLLTIIPTFLNAAKNNVKSSDVLGFKSFGAEVAKSRHNGLSAKSTIVDL